MNFHLDETWKDYDKGNNAALRLETIRDLIPKDVTSILDVGCGNGIITNELSSDFQITGLDSSEAALSYLKCSSILGSIESIPCADHSFDLVMCNEVLEHLDTSTLHKGIRELKRLSRKYILISVPNQEQLQRHLYKCARCGLVNHAYGHVQSISIPRLNNLLLPEYHHLQARLYGTPSQDSFPLLLTLRQQLLGQWFAPHEGAKCDACGSTSFMVNRNVLTKAVNGVNHLLITAKPFWFSVLYSL